MMSPRQVSEDLRAGSSQFRHTPLQIIHIIGNFMRIWSVYSMYRYLNQTGAPVILFLFCCLVPASILFLILQKPWKGRPLSNQQVVPSIINGGITALYFIMWGKGLKSCGPVRAILAEYSGAVLGVLSAVLYGRRGHLWKKVLASCLTCFSCDSDQIDIGRWAYCNVGIFLLTSSGVGHGNIFSILYPLLHNFLFSNLNCIKLHCCYCELNLELPWKDSPDAEVQTEQVLGMKEMVVPIFAGILSALRRVIARRVSLKNQLKRRLHAITIASATCFLFPAAMWSTIVGSPSGSSVELPFSTWAFLSTSFFGIILIFYVDSIAEERLLMVFSSPRHLMAAGGCIIVMEIVYKMDFSLTGFLICCLILGFGIYEATSLERTRKDSLQSSDLSNGVLDDQIQMSSLPT
uniref:Zinc transporter 5 n=1 Tax=Quercus lobata TaxID=97700 RepID=A0A7N2QZ81_QUELO